MTQLQEHPQAVGAGSPSLLKELFSLPAFLPAVLVLLAAAVGLNASVKLLKLHFRKEAVPLTMTFDKALPAERILGTWVQACRAEQLEPDLKAALGTEHYLFCDYVNAAAFGRRPEQVLKLFEGKDIEQQRTELARLREQDPAAVVRFAITYYTGKADTVAHIPERCYVGEGFDPENPATEAWGAGRDLSVRYITFNSPTSPIPRHVAYFFHVNGGYQSDSLAVRRVLQDLFARYGYYAKVELLCVAKDREASKKSMQAFLAEALPAVESALPDWKQFQGR